MSVLATPGADSLLTRDLAIYRAHDQHSLALGLLRSSTFVVAVTCIVLTPAFLLTARVYSGADSGLLRALVIGSALIPLSAFARMRAHAIAGLGQVVWARLPDLLVRPLVLAAAALVLFALTPTLDSDLAIAATITSWAVSLAVSNEVLRRRVRAQIPQGLPASDWPRWRRAAGPLFLFAIVNVLFTQLGIIMVQALSTSSSAGLYAVASRGAAIVSLGFVGAAAASAPAAARLWSTHDVAGQRQLLIRMGLFSGGYAAVCCVVLVIFAPNFLSVFGHEYIAAANAFRILCVGQFVFAATGICSTVMLANGGERFAALAMAASLAGGVGLCTLLIPPFGTVGAAAGISGSLTLGQSIVVGMFVRRWRRRPGPSIAPDKNGRDSVSTTSQR